jgi:hypothetical protein
MKYKKGDKVQIFATNKQLSEINPEDNRVDILNNKNRIYVINDIWANLEYNNILSV